MLNVVLMPNIALQLDRHNREMVPTISDLLLVLEFRLTLVLAFVERSADDDGKRAQSANVTGLLAQAREKMAGIIAMSWSSIHAKSRE